MLTILAAKKGILEVNRKLSFIS